MFTMQAFHFMILAISYNICDITTYDLYRGPELQRVLGKILSLAYAFLSDNVKIYIDVIY